MSSSIPPTGTLIQPQQQQASERSVLLARGPVPYNQHSPMTSPSSGSTGRSSASAKRKRPRRAGSWFPSCCGSDPALYDDDGAGKRKLPVEYQSKLVIKHHVPTVSHHIEICTPPPSSPPQVIDLPLPLPSFSSAGHSSTTIFSLGSQAVFATPTAAAYGDAATVTPASSASTNSYSRFQDAAEVRQGRLRAAPASAQTLASLTASPPDGLRPVSSMVEIGGRLARGALTSSDRCYQEIPQRRGADEKRRRRRLGNIDHYDENVRAYLGALQRPSMDGDHNQRAEAENPEKRLSTASTLSRYSSQSTEGDGVDDNNGRSKRQDQASSVSGKVSHSSIEHSTSRRRATASCTSSSAASSTIEQSRSSGALSERSPPIGDVLCQFPSLVTLQGDRKLGMASLVGGATRLRGFDVDDSHDDDDVYGKGEEVDRASITSSDIEGLLVKAGTVSDRDNQSPSHSTNWQNKLVPENSMQSETPSRDNMHRRKESGAHSLRSMKSVRTLKRAANDDDSSASSSAATPRHSRKRNASVSSARSSSGAPRSSPPELPLPPVPATAAAAAAAAAAGPQSVRRATVGTSAPSSSSSSAGVHHAAHQKRTTAPARVRLEASAAALHRQRAQGQLPHADTYSCRATSNRGSYYEQGQSIAL